MFPSQPCAFYLPNLERDLSRCTETSGSSADDIIGTNRFGANQCDLNIIWHIIEEQTFASPYLNVTMKNIRYFVEKFSVDINSSTKVLSDVFAQLIEDNCALVLPHLVKFCDICENREQFRWIKNSMLKLQESVHIENAVCHAVS